MTETDRTVQVPVSLIEEVADALGVYERYALAARVRDLLSQPNPTAEPEWSVILVKHGGHYRYVKVVGGDWDSALEKAENANEGWEALQCGPYVSGNGVAYHSTIAAEPPRIEDLAPGTTFTEEVRWEVTAGAIRGEQFAVPIRGGDRRGRVVPAFDPSTIRDVTPPKDAA